MKCILHIGTEKTATTTLQSFLHLNRDKLAKKGFLFTKSAGLTNNFKLPVSSYNIDKRDDLTNICNIFTNEDLINFQKKIITDLKKEIAENKQPNIIFSSEHIQSRLTSQQEITRLKSILEKIGLYDISVVIYLRNPTEIATSLFSNCIINGHSIDLPPSPKDSYFNRICNHKNTLLKFEKVFGREHLIPKIFDRSEFKNGSIIEDFLDVLGMPLYGDFEIPNNQNTSLSPIGLELLRRINRQIPLFIDNRTNPLRGNIIAYFQKHFNNSKYVMPKYLFDEYQDAFKESNEWVRKRWFPSKESFFYTKEYENKTTLPLADNELDQTANLLANIWIDKQESIISLTKSHSSES